MKPLETVRESFEQDSRLRLSDVTQSSQGYGNDEDSRLLLSLIAATITGLQARCRRLSLKLTWVFSRNSLHFFNDQLSYSHLGN